MTHMNFQHIDLNAGAALANMARTIEQLQKEQKTLEAGAMRDFQQWRANPGKFDYKPGPQRDPATDFMTNLVLGSGLLDLIMPGLSEMTRSLALLGMTAAQERYEDAHASPQQEAMAHFMAQRQKKAKKSPHAPAAFEDLELIAEQEEYLEQMLAHKTQAQQFRILKQLYLNMVLQLAHEKRQVKNGPAKPAIAGSIMHHNQTVALFKANSNHTNMTNIRQQFNASAKKVVDFKPTHLQHCKAA